MKKIARIDTDFTPKTVILANGEFPCGEPALSLLRKAEFLVCCDGATNRLTAKTDRIPDAIVGDLDSLSAENKQRFSRIIHHVAEQESNDLTKAARFCVSIGKTDIVILGATGQREDHTLGNLSLLLRYPRELKINPTMITNHGMFVAIGAGDYQFESFCGQQVSIFNLGNTAVTSENLKYPLEKLVLPLPELWMGTLNQAEGDFFRLHTDGELLVFLAFYDAKK